MAGEHDAVDAGARACVAEVTARFKALLGPAELSRRRAASQESKKK